MTRHQLTLAQDLFQSMPTLDSDPAVDCLRSKEVADALVERLPPVYAAAPDLLEALRLFMDSESDGIIENCTCGICRAYALGRAAIAKAEGKQP